MEKMIVDSIAFYRIHFFNNKFGVIKSSSANPPYIFVTHDGGLSWGKKYYYNPNDTLLPPQYFYDVFCPEMNVIKVTANNDSTETFIISSSDGGNTWERGEEPPRGVYRIFFINRYIGWSCGTQKVNTGWYKEKIYKTEDGGMTWNVQVDTLLDKKNMALVNIVFADENYGLAVGLWSRLWHTTNGGKNWFTLEEPSENNFFYDVAYPAKDMVYGACYAYNQIWKYTGYFTGVAEIPAIQNINITLYPNPLPSGEPLKMKILLDFPHEAEISIYNYLGQLMDTPRRQFLNAGEATLQYSDYGYFPLGAYCLVIKIGSRAFSKSFVVY